MKKRMFLVWFVFAPAVAAFFLYIIHNIKWMSLDSPNLPSIDYSRLEFAKIESNSNIDNAIRNAVGSADSQNIPESSKNKLVDSIENLLLAYSEGTWDAFRAFRYPIDDQFVCTTSSFHNDTFISNSYRPYNCNLTPGGWRDFLDYANGTLGDWEVHWLDQVLWWTKEKHPRTVYSSGGRPVLGKAVATPVEATTDAPGTQVAVYQLESFTATWEHRRYSANVSERHRIGASFHGTNGVFHMGWRDGWAFYPRDQKEQPVHEAPRFSDDTDGKQPQGALDRLPRSHRRKAPPCGPYGSYPPVLPPAPAGDDLHEGQAEPFLGRLPGANTRRSAGVRAGAARIPSSLGISSDLSGTTKPCNEGIHIQYATTSCPPDVPVQRMRILCWQIGK